MGSQSPRVRIGLVSCDCVVVLSLMRLLMRASLRPVSHFPQAKLPSCLIVHLLGVFDHCWKPEHIFAHKTSTRNALKVLCWCLVGRDISLATVFGAQDVQWPYKCRCEFNVNINANVNSNSEFTLMRITSLQNTMYQLRPFKTRDKSQSFLFSM